MTTQALCRECTSSPNILINPWKNHSNTPLHTHQDDHNLLKERKGVWERMWRNWNPCWCEYKITQLQCKTIWQLLKMLNTELPFDSAILSGIWTGEMRTYVHTETRRWMFLGAKKWEQPKCPSVDECVNIWHVHTMEYYSALRRSEVLMHTTTRMKTLG